MPTISLTLSAAAANRLQDALTETLDLVDEDGDPRVADINDAKDYIVQDLKQLIRTSEKRVAAAAVPTGTDPSIT
jgi:hypothetical protein